MIHLTLEEIINSAILYGIIHGIWVTIKHLETEAGKVIKAHVKNGHSARFKECSEDSCAIRLETGLS